MLTYLGYRCCENNNLVELTHPLHERIYTWSLDHIYIVILALNLNWNSEICLMEDLINISMYFLDFSESVYLKTTVDQRLIKI